MDYGKTTATLNQYRRQIAELREKMRAVQAEIEPEPVRDYELATVTGPVRLSALFGAKPELFVVHNMGASCRYCTLWADGFNGIYPHLADRAGFVVTSPDAPELQRSFAADRGWRFPMASHQGTDFASDMGYRNENGGWLPGLSVFRRDGNGIERLSDTRLGPGDDFCALWHFLDLLPEGRGEWDAKYRYA
jgi:predicted dithiol-disulfide oxidoreductase (DUF899 family)